MKNFRHGVLSAGLLTAFILGAAVQEVRAVSEEDPSPGPPILSLTRNVGFEGEAPATKDNTFTYPFPEGEEQTRGGAFASAMGQPTGALTGKIVYTCGGHGFAASASGTWSTGRGNNNSVVEDLGNQDQMTIYANYCFNAGATVVPYRPVGNQTNEVIVDDSSPSGFQLFGTWSNSVNIPYYGEDSDAVHYRYASASATETARARYTPNIPEPGFYPIYTWVKPDNDRLTDQLYRIVHSGGAAEVKVNHRMVGQGWVYLGTYYLNAGTDAYVEISNKTSGTTSGRNAFADAIRFGNGMGDVLSGGSSTNTVSGKSREDEASRYWVLRQMTNAASRVTNVYDRGGTHMNDNVGAPLRMAAYMNREAEGVKTDRVYISFHSNAGGGRGADGLWNDTSVANVANGSKSPYQLELATYLGKEVNTDLYNMGTAFMENQWANRSTHAWSHPSYAFGELNYLTNSEMDSTIIEVAYHDSTLDAPLLRSANVRNWIARSTLKGTIRYFNQYGGAPLNFLPDPPTSVKAVHGGSGNITVSWTPEAVASYSGGAPTGFVVYSSPNGYAFGNPVTVSGGGTLSVTIPGVALNEVTYFRVAAVNAGGESFPSEVVAVRPSNIASSVLAVNAFDRLDRAMNPTESGVGSGTHDRVKPWKSNSFDYVVQHAKALHSAGYAFDSASNEYVNATLLSNYNVLVWIAGEESTGDSTFSATEQAAVTGFLANGKGLFVSGAEIGWDLDQANNGRSFYRNVLGVTYTSDSSGTYSFLAGTGLFSGVPSGSFGQLAAKDNTVFPPTATAPYLAEYADVIAPTNTGVSSVIMRYSGNTNAAVATNKPAYRTVVMGFPFECIVSESTRNTLMTKSMDFLSELTAPNASVNQWFLY